MSIPLPQDRESYFRGKPLSQNWDGHLNALPQHLRVIPVELWQLIFSQYLTPKDLYRTALVCRLWQILTESAIEDCVKQSYRALAMLHDFIDSHLETEHSSANYEPQDVTALDINSLRQAIRPQSFMVSLWRECRSALNVFCHPKQLADADEGELLTMLHEIQTALQKRLDYFYVVAFSPSDVALPGFRLFFNSNMGSNLVFAHSRTFLKKTRLALKNKKIHFLDLSLHVLSNPEWITAISKSIVTDQIRVVSVFSLNDGAPIDEMACMIRSLRPILERLSNVSLGFSLLLNSTRFTQEDALEIADFLQEHKNLVGFQLFETKSLSCESLQVVYRAMVLTGRMHIITVLAQRDQMKEIDSAVNDFEPCDRVLIKIKEMP